MELQWPLILFTTFVAWSAGLFATQAVFALKDKGAKSQQTALTASAVLLVVGGIAVFFHLQHWERIFNGFGHITSGITQELIARTVMAAHDHLSAVPVVPSTDTLKNVDDRGGITGSADRSHIVRVQTPQVFSADLIKGALTDAVKRELPLTDDCSAMERMGVTTQTVPGDDENIKITTPWDLDVARAILKGRLSKA